MANYYVALTGNDANAGTLASPFRTFSKGVSVLGAGDTLYVRGGTWTGARLQLQYKTGTAANPITVTNYPGEVVWIDGQNIRYGSEWEGLVDIRNCYYCTVKGTDVGGQKGFNVKNANQRGFCIYLYNNNKFDGVHAEYTFHNGIMIDGGNLDSLLYSEATECAYDNNSTFNGNNGTTNPNGFTWSGGITVGNFGVNVTNATIRGCRAWHNRGEGIGVFHCTNPTVEDCISYDNWSVNIYPDSAPGAIIRRNIVYTTANAYLRNGGGAWGISLANESAGFEHKNTTCINNIIRDGSLYVVTFTTNGAGNTMDNMLVAHNTIVNGNVNVGGGAQINGTYIGANYIGAVAGGANPALPAYYTPNNPVSIARRSTVLTDFYQNNRLDPTKTGAIDTGASGGGGPAPTNLALNKTATASSVEGTGFAASAAVDGNSTTTRWSSLFSDPQWIQVDLGARYSITGVTLVWEAAYATAYQVQVSDDAVTWTTIYGTTTGTGGTQSLTGLSGAGRYVRMYGTARGSVWGYSLWEFQVFGGSIVTVTNPGAQTTTVGQGASLQIGATDSGGGTLTYAATGLPAGLSINTTSGLISGTPTVVGANNVTVTVTSSTGSTQGSAAFTWTIADVVWGPLPAPWVTQDIGNAAIAGAGEYLNGVFRLKGSGYWWWGTTDDGRIVEQPVTGDFDFIVRVPTITNTNAYAKAGIMVRSSLATDAAGCTINTMPAGAMEAIRRPADGGNSVSDQYIALADKWLRMTRSGNTIRRYSSPNASPVSVNVALTGAASASSVQTAGFEASQAIDGNSTTTRWSSAPGVDPQWLQIDLGHTRTITRVKLTWEAAYATAYQVQVSSDAVNWTTVFTRTGGTGGIEDLTVTATAGRYVRLYGTTRATAYGYSVWEMEVYGTPIWTEFVPQQDLPLGASAFVGMFVNAADNTQINTSTFDNVALVLLSSATSTGSASGTSTVVGASFVAQFVDSVGSAAGVGTASGAGSVVIQSAGSSSGTGAVTGVAEESNRLDFAGSASGTSTATAIAVVLINARGDSRGVGTLDGRSQLVVQATGESVGTSSTESNAYLDAVASAFGQADAVADTEIITIVPLSAQSASSRTKAYIVQQGDSLRAIAFRLYHDASRWTEIAGLNNLRPPHIVDSWRRTDRLPNTAIWGDTIQVAVASDAGQRDTAQQLFGYDVQLTRGLFNVVDGDILPVGGVDNLKQAVQHRVRTLLGELLYHSEYGCNVQLALGLQAEPVIRLMGAAWVHDAIKREPRIASIEHIDSTVDTDKLMVTVRATTAGDNTPIDLNLVTP